MSTSNSGNKNHDATVNVAESVRQSAAAGASQATIKTAEITFYRAALASAIANGIQPGVFISALRELGTGGV